jgi:outer membrane lipoprotein-sorting protein
MKKIIAGLVAAALAALCAAPALAADDVLEAIQRKYAGLKSLAADYTRVTTTKAMEGVFQSESRHTASGVLYYRYPDKLRLDQKRPDAERLITNGRTVWWYIPAEKLVYRYQNVDVYGELKPLLDFLGGIEKLTQRFDVQINPAGTDGQADHRLELTALDEDWSGPEGIVAWFDPDDRTLTGFRLTTLTGEITDFSLSNLEINPDVSPELFGFTIPPDVKLVEEMPG